MAPIEVTGTDSSTQAEVVTIPKTEFDELSTRASQSSQNFERLRKANETLAEYEARVGPLENLNAPDNSGGGAVADPRVDKLERELQGVASELAMTKVLEAYPVLKGKEVDFEEYRKLPENAGLPLATAAKAFVTEKELLVPRRPGLESPTGGGHAPLPSGKLSAEDAKKLRETNFKAYSDGIKNGTIQIE